MNRAGKVISFCALVLFIAGCQKAPAPSSTPAAKADVADAQSGFVILAGLGLADITDGAVKYVDSLTLGEKVSLTGQARKAGPAGSERDFVEVRRESGKAGWARADYVVASSMLGVVTADGAVIYSEPKNTGATAKIVPKLSILAIHAETAGQAFIRITTYDPAAKVLSHDVYMKNEGVSTRGEDVQSAILLLLAAASDKPTQKRAFLQSAAKDYPGSMFITQVEDSIAALNAPPPSRETEKFFASMASTADAVNVRDAPDETTGKVVATLANGQAVDVEEKTVESYTVLDKTAPWYRIKEPAGWVFGAWLSTGE